MKKFKLLSIAVVLLVFSAIFIGCTANTSNKIVFYVEGQEYSQFSVSKDGKFTLPVDPEKKGYRFVGWYFDEGFKEPLTSKTKIKGSRKAYARFDKKQVKLYINGNLQEEVDLSEVETKKPAPEDLTFDGWYLERNLRKDTTERM